MTLFIISMASVAATDVSDIDDNQYSNVLNSSDSATGISSSGCSENYDDRNSPVGTYCSDSSIVTTDSNVSNDDKSSINSIGSADSNGNSYEFSSMDNDGTSTEVLSSSNAVSNSAVVRSSDTLSNSTEDSSSDVVGNSLSGSSSKALGASTIKKNLTAMQVSSTSVLSGDIFNVTLKDKNSNKPLSGKTVTFLLNGNKSYTKVTNSLGVASLSLNLIPGNYVIGYAYGGDSYYQNFSNSARVSVGQNPTAIENSGSSIIRGNFYCLTLKDSFGNVLSNKTIVMNYRGNTYKRTTNSNGTAFLKINCGLGNTYKLNYRFAGDSRFGSSSGSTDIAIKLGTSLTGSGSTVVRGNCYYVTLKDANGNPLANKKVVLALKNRVYNKTTDSNGRVSLRFTCDAGKTYNFSYEYGGSSYYGSSSSGTFGLAVKLGTAIANSGTSIMNGSLYNVTLKDDLGNVLSGKTIVFTLNGKSYNISTNSKGVASLSINVANPNSYALSYGFSGDALYSGSSGSLSLNVKSDKFFTISQILATSKTLRTYVETYGKVPSTVSVNGVSLNLSSFSYLMSKALVSINSGKSSGYIGLMAVSANYSNNGKSSINGNLYKADYIALANKLANYTESKGAIPNYINTSLGSISPNLYTFGLSKALQYYSVNNVLPNYLILKGSDVSGTSSSSATNSSGASYSSTSLKGNSSQFKKGLNEIANLTASQLSAYLSSSGYDSLNSAIKSLANSLVSGKTTTWAKAQAIFNYVRDQVSYSFYSNSYKGASGTLSGKSANCCDQANLVVALCRAANIPARFSHAQGCTFSSGLVTGHVWAQIYVDGVWYSADATSTRNSLGNVHNWNVKSFSSLKQYAHLPF